VRLTELEPQWLKLDRQDLRHSRYLSEKAEADGILFVCPKCLVKNGGQRPGVHSVICWNPSVPQSVLPNPGRWDLQGSSFDDLTLVAGSSSVLIKGGCAAHFYIRNGDIVPCDPW